MFVGLLLLPLALVLSLGSVGCTLDGGAGVLAAPEIITPADGAHVGDGTPNVAGDAPFGATIELFSEDGRLLGTTTAAATRWMIEASELSDGEQGLFAVARDGSGASSPQSSTVRIHVDTSAPATPVVLAPADGSVLPAGTVELRGVAEPGAYIEVERDGRHVETGPVSAEGRFAVELKSFSPGFHGLMVLARDAAGNRSAPSDHLVIRIDGSGPMGTTITAPSDGTATADSTPRLVGTAEIGAEVEVLDGELSIGQVRVGEDGLWSLTAPELEEGVHVLRARATDASGNTGPDSDPISVTVDTRAPAAPTIEVPSTAIAAPSAPRVEGLAEPGAMVDLSANGELVATERAVATGAFLVQPAGLDDGVYTLQAVARDAAGNRSPPSRAVSVTIDSQAPAAPVIEAPASNGSLATNTFSVSGMAEPLARLTLVHGSQEVTGVAAMDGSFSLPIGPLADGTRYLTLVARDAAGNSSRSQLVVRIDTRAPPAPSIVSPVAGAYLGSTTVYIAGDDDHVAIDLFRGVDGPLLGSGVALGFGWSIPLDLGEGEHQVVAVASDDVGNASDRAAVSFVVDVTPPDVDAGSARRARMPTLQDAVVSDSSPLSYAWSQESGPGVVAFGSPAAEDTTLAADLDGAYVVRITGRDAAGNQAFDTVAFTWDTTAPTVLARSPLAGESNVGLDRPVHVSFSEALDLESIAGNLMVEGGGATGTLSVKPGDRTVVWTPDAPLSPATVYTVSALAGLTDVAGNPLVPVSWTFTTADPGVATTVPYYSNAGAWNDYLVADGSSMLQAHNTVCTGDEDGGYGTCFHAGVLRAVSTGDASCAGHTAMDELDAFEWVCDDGRGDALMVSTGLRDGVALSDLVNTDTLQFRPNSVSVAGRPGGAAPFTTARQVWWSNAVTPLFADAVLDRDGSVYVTAESVFGDVEIAADRVALVLKRTATLTGSGAAHAAAVSASGARFLWIEGEFRAAGGAAALWLSDVGDSVIDRVHVQDGWSGVSLRDGSHRNRVANLSGSGNTRGLSLRGASDNLLSSVELSGSQWGVNLESGSRRNTLSDVRTRDCDVGVSVSESDDNLLERVVAEGGSSGVRVAFASGNRLHDIATSGHREAGLVLTATRGTRVLRALSSNNGSVGVQLAQVFGAAFVGLTAVSNADRGVVLGQSHNNVLSNVTVANNGDGGVVVEASNGNVLQRLVATNNGRDGVHVHAQATGNLFADLALASHPGHGLHLDEAPQNRFHGVLRVGGNAGGDCFVDAESASGDLADDGDADDVLHAGECHATAAAVSSFLLATGVELAGSLVGKVGHYGPHDPTGDDLHPDDDPSPGTADRDSLSSWHGFEHGYRAWGLDGAAFPAADHRGRWVAGAGRIWDYAPVTTDAGNGGDPALLGILPVPTGDDALEHLWTGSAADQAACTALVIGSTYVAPSRCRSTFLVAAVELDDGNENGLCETGEVCQHALNLGSYQGHGGLTSAGAFADGTLSGIVLWTRAQNGY